MSFNFFWSFEVRSLEDLPVGLLLGAHHVDVESYQKLPDSGDSTTPGRNEFGLSKIR
jgi:hypothetical protein